MADDSPDDIAALFEEATAAQLAGSDRVQLFDEADTSQKATSQSPKDTRKSPGLQAQASPASGSRHAAGNPKRRHGSSLLRELAAEARAEELNEFYHERTESSDGGDPRPILTEKRQELGELLAWKESLRLLALHEFIPAPYYESWTKEANLFFRRLVIIKRRSEGLKK